MKEENRSIIVPLLIILVVICWTNIAIDRLTRLSWLFFTLSSIALFIFYSKDM